LEGWGIEEVYVVSGEGKRKKEKMKKKKGKVN
jgi:hypothetical protein